MKDIRRTNRDGSLEISLLFSLFNYLDKSNAQLNLVTPVDPKLVNTQHALRTAESELLYTNVKTSRCRKEQDYLS